MAERRSVAPADALPILVGVVGKRSLDAAARKEFEKRFDALLAHLDHALPDTPKLLVCGGAAGTDLAAVRRALARPGWAAALVLPLDDALFAEDFTDTAHAEDGRYLREDLAGHPRVVRKIMRPLHRDGFDDSRLEPADAARFAPADLHRAEGQSNPARAAHYEQLGLWLARYATLLIAVGPAEVARPDQPHRPGGTARIVAYRRTAIPDAPAAQVIARSSELLSSSPFEEQDGGYVLWLDPTEKPPPPEWSGLPGVRVLRPLQRVAEVADAATVLSCVVDCIYRAPMHDPCEDADEHRRRGKAALTLAHAFQAMHARRRGWLPWLLSRHKTSPPPFGAERPAAFLEAVRKGALDRQQVAASARTRLAQRASALLFVFALAGLEIYAELAEEAPWLLAGYVALLLGIAGVAGWVSQARLQVRGEDYRGLKEMLRVQIAWWSAGIDRMVDRVHLRSIDTDLRLVREAAAAVTMWAVLRCTELPTLNAAARPPQPKPVAGWIDGQADFFAKRARPQFGAKRLADMAFGVTFAAAMLTMALLFAVRLSETELPERLLPFAPLALAALPAVGALLAGCVLDRVTRRWTGAGQPGAMTVLFAAATLALTAGVFAQAAHRLAPALTPLPPWALCPHAWAAPLGFVVALGGLTICRVPPVEKFDVRPLDLPGRVAAVAALVGAVLLAALAFAPLIHADVALHGRDMGKLVMVQAVLLLGGTGMVRWYTDRRNHLAQAAQYDDMLRAFRRAQDWWRHQGGSRLDRDAQERLVQLGELALDENEAWLKAHRDRPAEPIAGA